MLQRRSRSRRAALGLASVGAGVALVMAAVTTPAGADVDREKEHVGGNPKCVDLGYENGFKIDTGGEFPPAGTYTTGDPGTSTEGNADGFTVTISYASTNPINLGFEANTPVDAVLVKAGPGGYLYTYTPPTTEDTGLHSPKPSVSHITFCWDGEVPPPPTTTTTAPEGEPTTTTTVVDGETPPGEGPPGEAPPAPVVTGQPDFTG